MWSWIHYIRLLRLSGGSDLGEYGIIFVNCKAGLKRENISKHLQNASSSDSH